MESVFLEIEGRPVPFFIADLDYRGGDILKLTFDGYQSPDKVSEFTGCDVFLTDDYSQQTEREDDPVSLDGYMVKLTSGETLGTIHEVILNSGQWLLKIISPRNKEILVPFHEDFLLNIDYKNRYIVMDIPEGLTEIN
jgi:16S rRNA processing protein RimM